MSYLNAFPDHQVFMIMDYETYSEIDLEEVGAYEYAAHPSTEIICVAWKTGTRTEFIAGTAATYSWVPSLSDDDFSYFYSDLINPDIIKVAHNAFFEQVITLNTFFEKYMHSMKRVKKTLGPSSWLCTASMASALALPRSLEKSVDALRLPMKKNMDGRRLILKWCKPKKPSAKDPSTRHTDRQELDKIVRYCIDDIEATTGLFLRLPMLTPTEREVWCLDQTINLRGFSVDRGLVQTILSMIEKETARLHAETEEITMGVLTSVNQVKGVLKYLESEGYYLPDLQKKTVEDALNDGLVDGVSKRLLEIRQTISKTSTAKYEMLEQRSRSDGRSRDNLLYHAASTGRWGGVGFQPQNLPRGSIKNTILAASIIAEGDIELIRLIYGDPMDAFSSCLRNMIIADQGHVLDVADYAAIEARVLFWVADDRDGLRAYREGKDQYIIQASAVFNREITKEDAYERFIGKGLILGCGYQMGAEKFVITCKNQGQEVELELATKAVAAYRREHQPVVQLWGKIGRAAIAAVENPGKTISINRTKWFLKDNFLFCELPSGRCLAYADPSVQYEEKWGRRVPVLYFYGVDSVTKNWIRQNTYGGKLVENVVQGIARDLMAAAMLRIENTKRWRIELTVHDELVAQRSVFEKASNEEFCNLMAALPDWAEGCPIAVEGWEGKRYRK